jgi:hypothetical protein
MEYQLLRYLAKGSGRKKLIAQSSQLKGAGRGAKGEGEKELIAHS